MPAPATTNDYPSLADFKQILTDARIVMASDTKLQSDLDDAITDFEAAIGRKLLAVRSTRSLPCHGQRVQGLPSTAATVYGVSIVLPSGTTVLAEGDDWDAMSATGESPWEWLEFSHYLLGSWAKGARKALQIDAAWGLGSTLPAKARSAILAGAVMRALPIAAANISLGRVRIDMGEQSEYFSIRGDGGPYDAELKNLKAIWDSGVKTYLRVTVGVSR